MSWMELVKTVFSLVVFDFRIVRNLLKAISHMPLFFKYIFLSFAGWVCGYITLLWYTYSSYNLLAYAVDLMIFCRIMFPVVASRSDENMPNKFITECSRAVMTPL